MAQSAAQKRTPLGIEPFWDKPSVDPPLKWEKWQMQAKLALLAKENITIDTLLEPKPETVQLPLEPIYEVTITGSSAQSERERLARNAQSKMNWENRCQRQLEIGKMCGDKPWAQADRKTVSMLYLSLGMSRWTVSQQQNFGQSWKQHLFVSATLHSTDMSSSPRNRQEESLSNISSGN